MTPAAIALGLFLGGAVLVVVATERLLEGLLGISRAARIAPFVASALLSGLEAENVAVGLAAGQRGSSQVALGTVYGGSVFLVCAALGGGALIAPLLVRLPRAIPVTMVGAAILAGLPLTGAVTPRAAGAFLLVAFAAVMGYVVLVSRRHQFLESGEVREAAAKQRSVGVAVALTLIGIALISIGGELVARGAEQLVAVFGVPAGLIGMVVTPAAIELEEVIRQVIPARRGHGDVSAGNVVGTLFYFTLFNLGLIALITPVRVPSLTRLVDWPFLVGATLVAAVVLARGRVGRPEGALLLAIGVAYATLHVFLR